MIYQNISDATVIFVLAYVARFNGYVRDCPVIFPWRPLINHLLDSNFNTVSCFHGEVSNFRGNELP